MDEITALNLLLTELPKIAKFKSLEQTKSARPYLIKAAQTLAILNPTKSTELINVLNQTYSLAPDEPEYIPIIMAQALQIVNSVEQEFAQRTARHHNSYLKVGGVEKSSEYLKAREKYSSFRSQIDKLEEDIEYYPSYDPKLHERMKYGMFKRKFHARLTDNLRVIYSVS